MIDIPSFSKLDPPTLHPCIYDATATVAVRFPKITFTIQVFFLFPIPLNNSTHTSHRPIQGSTRVSDFLVQMQGSLGETSEALARAMKR
jgi:hypothetical protein